MKLRYYTLIQFGNTRQFLHPDDIVHAEALQRLTGRVTCTAEDRMALEKFNPALEWEEVIAPRNDKTTDLQKPA